VSHGPHCLDGVAAAAAIARYYDGVEVRPVFSGNPQINQIIQGLDIEAPLDEQELWITDISWNAPESDRRLRDLATGGLPIYWIDHHRTAIERVARGGVDVPFAHKIVDDRVSAARLVYEYLQERLRAEGRSNSEFDRFARVVAMADDNDRWLHAIPGSRELALTLRAMNGIEAFDDLRGLDERVAYTPRMQAAYDRIEAELARSFELAERTRKQRSLDGGVHVVSAVCDGYASEIGDRWGKALPNAVFVLFDLKGGAISYRRSPDCTVDLSRVAGAFGGGGHPAASGSEMPDLLVDLADAAGERVAAVVAQLAPARASGDLP
ncbi:MAG: hypothetical protein ACREQJ_02455, partial [Candidatus Binatia bacterium]